MNKAKYLEMRKKLNFSFSGPKLAFHLALDALLFTGIFFALQSEHWVSVLWIGILMFRSFGLMHEAVHHLAHPKPFINDAIGLVSGALCFLPYQLWKKLHLEHHYWAGNYKKDPVLEIVRRTPRATKGMKSFLNFWWKTRIPLPGFLQNVVFWYHCGRKWLENLKTPSVWLEFWIPTMFWSAALSQMSLTQFGLLSAGALFYLVLVEAINFPHHVGKYLHEPSESEHLPAWEQHLITRSCVYSGWFQHLVLLNFNFHTEHHLFPDLPWHQLEKAHEYLKAELTAQLEIAPHDWLQLKRQNNFEEFIAPAPPLQSKPVKAA